MKVSVACQPADVSAAALGLHLNGPLPEILVEHTITGPLGALQLGVIGASHVATVTAGNTHFREEMSCNVPGPLPRTYQQPNYVFSSTVTHTDAIGLHQYATDLDDSWLVAQFPGAGPYHITAVKGWWDKTAWKWHTLHFYPEEYTIVSTQSRYQL